MMSMIGLATYAATKRSFLGFDYTKLMSAAGGALSAYGGGGGGQGGDAAAAAERARLEEQRKQAEKSANTWKLVGIVGIIAVVGGVIMFRPKPQAA